MTRTFRYASYVICIRGLVALEVDFRAYTIYSTSGFVWHMCCLYRDMGSIGDGTFKGTAEGISKMRANKPRSTGLCFVPLEETRIHYQGDCFLNTLIVTRHVKKGSLLSRVV